MKTQLEKIKKEFIKGLEEIKDTLQLEELEQKFFSRRSGEMTEIMKSLKELSGDAKKEFGKLANEVKKELEGLYSEKKKDLDKEKMGGLADKESIDVTQPKLIKIEKGHLHPITQIQNEIEDLFTSMGFVIADGPELDSDYYNFEAVNIDKDHPARDMQDTFYIKDHANWVMRTHTSTMQVRGMQKYGVPLRIIAPGKCFRNEATDVRHEHTFYQFEGVVVDKDISLAHMKGVLETVAKHLFGEDTEVRLRPKYYPFVEPGVNGEVTCYLCKGKGCRLCKQSGWLEIFGAGPCQPCVIKAGGADPEEYTGFAFGFGLDRLVLLKYGIEDIRHFHSGNINFLKQF
jgi:phenylalanyl-tRNA synthetase alpha chain